MGEVRPELLHQLGVDAIPDQAVREEAPGALQVQTKLGHFAGTLCCTHNN
jgi:hypothetical protein